MFGNCDCDLDLRSRVHMGGVTRHSSGKFEHCSAPYACLWLQDKVNREDSQFKNRA